MHVIPKPDGETSDAASGRQDAGEGRCFAPDGVIRTASLMSGRREVIILHAGERYRLRITANDKLILTK
ncbi:hemin uptake protein HemP [Methylobacterium sp. sgz302003]|uniref:hemin uptake protein HemP n=1 Tax=Methylobacterium oryzisoli TaxID=3385502 RepID=UPI0039795824